MAKKVARKVAKKTASPKKKTGPKKIVPTHTPKRKRQIKKFKQEIKVTGAHPYTMVRTSTAIYHTEQELADEINKYAIWIQGEKTIEKVKVGRREVEQEVWLRRPEPPTITGLALFLGFASRQSLEDYDSKGGGWSYIIKRAKHFVAHAYELLLHEGKPVGGIFALKVIDKWEEKVGLDDNTLNTLVKGFNYVVPEKPPGADDPRDTSNDIEK